MSKEKTEFTIYDHFNMKLSWSIVYYKSDNFPKCMLNVNIFFIQNESKIIILKGRDYQIGHEMFNYMLTISMNMQTG
jgi:hypothetical protein